MRSCAPKLVKMMPKMPQERQKIRNSGFGAPPAMSIFASVKIRCLSTLKFDTTPVKPATRTKMIIRTLARSLYKCSLIFNSKSQCHMKCWNLDFCPSGPPEPRDGGECFAPLVCMSCFAQLRAETSENDARDASGKSKIEKSHF